MTDLTKQFDAFNLRARVYPALLTLLPVIVNVALLWPKSPLVGLVSVLVSVGALYAVADFARSAGQRLERRLIDKWDGLPAQVSLRLAGAAAPETTARRRALVERLTGRPLPSRQQETGDKARAYREYDAAIRDLIPRVRGEAKDPLLHAENVTYNFRRNALACRPLALAVAALAIAGDSLAVLADYQRGPASLALVGSALALLGWAVGARESRVEQAAETYASRLFQALLAL